jgi:hypothetical protein
MLPVVRYDAAPAEVIARHADGIRRRDQEKKTPLRSFHTSETRLT